MQDRAKANHVLDQGSTVPQDSFTAGLPTSLDTVNNWKRVYRIFGMISLVSVVTSSSLVVIR